MPREQDKGKTFAEISKQIHETYKDRFDPISMRGFKAEMKNLREAQEKVKMKNAQTQQAYMMQQLTHGGMIHSTDPNDPLGEYANTRTGEHRSLGQVQEDGGDFTDTFYQDPSYDKLNDFDQTMANYFKNNPVPVSGAKVSTADPTNINPNLDNNISVLGPKGTLSPEVAAGMRESELIQKGITAQHNVDGGQDIKSGKFNPLRLAPILTNLIGMATAGKAEVETPEQITAMANQQMFKDIDLSGIKRDIAEQGRGFTRNNLSASGGNAGQFLSNELASQLNQMRALSNAGIQAQSANQQTDVLRAQEQARVDQFNAGIQSTNANARMQTKDINARNRAANQGIKSSMLSQLGTDIGNIGKEEQMHQMAIGASGGYNMFGQFVGLDNMQSRTGSPLLDDITKGIGNIFKKKNKLG